MVKHYPRFISLNPSQFVSIKTEGLDTNNIPIVRQCFYSLYRPPALHVSWLRNNWPINYPQVVLKLYPLGLYHYHIKLMLPFIYTHPTRALVLRHKGVFIWKVLGGAGKRGPSPRGIHVTPPKSVRNLHDPPQIQYGICMTPPPPTKSKHSI